MRESWYYADHNRQVGPLTLHELRNSLVAADNIQEIFVWCARFADWKPVIEVPEVRDLATSGVPTPARLGAAQSASRVAAEAAEPKEAPIIGIIGVGLGIASVITPYFAAVFFVPASLICGIVAVVKRQVGWGTLTLALSLIGTGAIIYTSHQISSVFAGRPGHISLPQPVFAPPPIVTQAQYDQILNDMTYEQVCAIIGTDGEELSRSNIAGITTVMYSWTNANGSNMNAMFQSDRLVNKAQFGLR
jgi:GYF domain 2